jgi:hypothetical protein
MRFVCLLALTCACPHPNGSARPYPEPKLDDIVARLAKERAEMTGFRADATMDYWLANQRAKGEVLIMAQTGARARFAALSPAGGSTIAEMACDGANFVYVDQQNNCTRSGPCTKASIARFFRIELEPDDFLHLALGTPPVIAGTGTVTWDGNCGCEKVELHDGTSTEKLTIDAKDKHFDVLDAELQVDGKVIWSVVNKDFREIGGHRVPGKSRFKSPANQEDLVVEWGKVEDFAVNPQLDASKFQLAAPAGLRMCPGP